MQPDFFWPGVVIAAHPEHKLVGRTRLQKTIKLLQRLPLPVPRTYDFMLFFYGPYSEGLHAEVGLLEQMGLVRETPQQSHDGTTYYVFEALEPAIGMAQSSAMRPFQPAIDLMSDTDPVVLELAATYDAFREMGDDHVKALERLRRKKGAKCIGGNEAKALEVLQQLGLPTA